MYKYSDKYFIVKDEFGTVIENIFLFKWDKLLLLVELRWAQKNISMNPYDHLESEKGRIKKYIYILINNKQCLYEHGGLN